MFEFQYFGVYRKMNIFWGMKILWIFLGVITKIDYVYGPLLCILGSFLEVKVQNGGYFGVAKISIIFLGCLKFLIFLGVNGRCWARAYV